MENLIKANSLIELKKIKDVPIQAVKNVIHQSSTHLQVV